MKLGIHTPFALHVELDRTRRPGPAIPVYRPGHGYCESCREYKPRAGKANKGWRCASCKESK